MAEEERVPLSGKEYLLLVFKYYKYFDRIILPLNDYFVQCN